MHKQAHTPRWRTGMIIGSGLGLSALLLSLMVLLAGAAQVGAANSVGREAARPGAPHSTSLVISQVYGGGGNANAPYQNDYIELFNPQAIPVVMSNWTVQYTSATGGTWQATTINGTIPPGGYYLVQEAAGTGCTGLPCGVTLPTPEASGTIPMSATAGKVALVSNATMLTGTCPTGGAIIDFVGYGTTPNCFEGSGPTAAPSSTTAALRNSNGCTDSDNNAGDFTVGAPAPRNSGSPLNPCVLGTPTQTITPGGPTNTPVNTGTATNTRTATTSATPTITPGGPTATATATVGAVRIHDIQGAQHRSPLVGQLVSSVPGIVTALRSNSFYLQDPSPDADNATSEGILVFTTSAPTVALGDLVLVSGTVIEFRATSGCATQNLTVSEIGAPGLTITVQSSGNALPTPVVIGNGGRIPPNVIIEDDANGDVEVSNVFDPDNDGIDFYESLEGMRVQVNNPVAVGPTSSFGEVEVLADNGANATTRTTRGGIAIYPIASPTAQYGDFNPERIFLDDLIANVPLANVGDHFSGPAIGVMDYSFCNFKLEITTALTTVSGGLVQETTTPQAANQLAIGNFNVENLAPSDPQSKFNALASLIINNLKSPDLLSIEEIQDNSGATNDGVVDADVTWGLLITAIQNAGGPTYVYRQINPVNNQDGGQPGGNIRQGFLYRTDRGLSFIDRPGGCSTCANTVTGGAGAPQLAFSPGRIDPNNPAFSSSRKPLAGEFLFNGRKLFIIGNHFNSKGGDQSLFGRNQPPGRSSEVQRNQQAAVVNNFVNQIVTLDPNANVVVLGDINDFFFSSALATLKGTVLTDLLTTLPLSERYTYVFEGNSQDLDHTLVSNGALNNLANFDVLHVNSEFAVQASDHDPQVALFNLPVITPTPLTTGTVVASTVVVITPSPTTTSTTTRTATPLLPTVTIVLPTLTLVPSTTTATTTPVLPSATTTAVQATTTRTGTSIVPSVTVVVPSVTVTNIVPSVTGTSIVPTVTGIVPTNTATVLVASATTTSGPGVTATATVCSVQFQDVAVTDPFYTFIRCLACRGIISGYTCGGAGEPCVPPANKPYFRTGALITRGQVSKMVALAAGLNAPLPSGQQTFEDVPSSNPFWPFIERLAGAGYISGYACGGANEPCQPPANRPYFRPFASITRGQLAKIDTNAAGYTDVIPSGQQTFEDVPNANPFWLYIERASIHGVISGYTCGGPGEPCVGPNNRPYFRTFASTTRGQASKIVANTFFPGCNTPGR